MKHIVAAAALAIAMGIPNYVYADEGTSDTTMHYKPICSVPQLMSVQSAEALLVGRDASSVEYNTALASLYAEEYAIREKCAETTPTEGAHQQALAVPALATAEFYARRGGAEQHFTTWRGQLFDMLDAKLYADSKYDDIDRTAIVKALKDFCNGAKPESGFAYPDIGHRGVDWATWHGHCDAVEALKV